MLNVKVQVTTHVHVHYISYVLGLGKKGFPQGPSPHFPLILLVGSLRRRYPRRKKKKIFRHVFSSPVFGTYSWDGYDTEMARKYGGSTWIFLLTYWPLYIDIL